MCPTFGQDVLTDTRKGRKTDPGADGHESANSVQDEQSPYGIRCRYHITDCLCDPPLAVKQIHEYR